MKPDKAFSLMSFISVRKDDAGGEKAAEQINKHELSGRETSLELGNGEDLSEKTVQRM